MYQRHWDSFTTFCASTLQNTSFPAAPTSVALFITHLSQRNLAIRTIRTYTSAISFVHKLNGHIDPATSFLVTKTIQGLSNSAPPGRTPLRPITRDLLYHLLDAIPFCAQSHYYNTMWAALFQLCYHALLRVGEAVVAATSQHTLAFSDLNLTPSSATITFRSFKHSQNATRSVTIKADPTPTRCPIEALQKYLRIRHNKPGPLFLDHNAMPINRATFSAFLKTTLAFANMQPDHYNTHSFRIGRTTQLAQDQHTQETIRMAGRWKSSAYRTYIRTDNLQLPR